MRRLIALSAALVVAACVPTYRSPSVALAGLDIESIGLFEQRFRLQLRVHNPNDIDIPVDSVSFAVEVGGQPFATGVSSQPVTIPRLGEGILEVKASSNLANFLRRFGELQKGEGGGLDYRIKGQLQIAGHGSVPFDSTGRMPFLRLPGGEDKSAPKRLPGAV